GGRLREAAAWVALVQQNQGQDKDAAAALPSLLALDHLAGGAASPPALEALPTLAATGSSARGARPDGLRAIFSALDETQPAPASDAEATIVPAAQAMPEQNLNLWLDLGDAAAKNRVGETVPLSLAGLDAAGIDGAEPLWLGRAIASLRQVGLEPDARRPAGRGAVGDGRPIPSPPASR